MKMTDRIYAKGQVSPCFIDLKTGCRIPWEERHNTISYDASFAMASAFGGNSTYIPNRIGIIYGSGSQFGTIGRDQSWNTGVLSLEDELTTKNADVQVVPFSFAPSLKTISKGDDSSSSSSSSDDQTIPGNAVTFHAHSDSVTPGSFGTYHKTSSSSEGSIFTSGTYIYQAVLLNKTGSVYRILARASLDNHGTYYTKPENFEVAIDWTIKFF